MGKLFLGGRLILVWSVTKEIKWVSVRLLKNREKKKKTGPERPNPASLLNYHF